MERSFLIDSWFPFGEVSVESIRERATFTALPAMYALHVWFARRPLVVSRATILYSLLQNEDKKKIFKILGIPLDKNIISIQQEIEENKIRKKERKKENPYTWDRAFKHTPTESELEWLHDELKKVWGGKLPTILDPMAGGGSIPFEALRLGLPVIASDLNPVAFLILKATLEYPAKFGEKLIPAVEEFCNEVHKRAYEELKEFFPNVENEKIIQYQWCRTIVCTKCGLIIPLSPNWWIMKNDNMEKQIAIKIHHSEKGNENYCTFELIKNPSKIGYDPDEGTDVGKDARCPRCPRIISGEEVKKQAQEGRMGHQLFCINTKIPKGGRGQQWNFRLPTKEEINASLKIEKVLETKLIFWKKLGIIPEQYFPSTNNDTRPLQYGMKKWIDMFNPRQLFTHLTYLEKFDQVKQEWLKDKSKKKDFVEAIIVYSAITLDSCYNYNSLLSSWHTTRLVTTPLMQIQAFPFKTSYVEWNQIGPGVHGGFKWALSKTKSILKEITSFIPSSSNIPKIVLSDASKLIVVDKSIDQITVDPPYGENVMYGDVMDFFYVWLKKTVGDLFPNEFKNELSDKDAEAVTNKALYRDAGRGQAKKLADQHYQSKLEACFKEMNRVLKDDGILTVMFTHRNPEAWAGLTTSLMNAGFTFKSSWPVSTEPGKYGKRGKGVLKRTVILVCKKRTQEKKGLWSNVTDELYKEAESKVKEYSEAGITGPDLLVCTYGPILGKFADYSLIKDSSGITKGPKDALELVAEVVNKFTINIPGADLETMAYVNLISSFSELEIDEADAGISVMFGSNLSIHDLVDKGLVTKKGGKVTILTSKQRLDAGIIDLAKSENLKLLIDVVHACLVTFDKLGIKAVKKLLEDTGKDFADSGFIATLKAISHLGSDVSGKSPMISEIKSATSLLSALGLEPESVLKKGEKITHYTKEANLDDYA